MIENQCRDDDDDDDDALLTSRCML